MEVAMVRSTELSAADRRALRALLDDAFAGDFSDDDWDHAFGGWHALVREADRIAAHASVVPRRLHVSGRALRAGYVEAVAVSPPRQRSGLGTAVMARIGERIQAEFELGALSSGEWRFYERLGWARWTGPSSVLLPDGRMRRTPEDDDGIMVLRCAATRDIDLAASIVCEARRGDSW
jgi:aminoglycoside 2'-N-acetyltransferase I